MMIDKTQWPLKEALLSNKKLIASLATVRSDILAPAPDDVFNALKLVAPKDVKVIMIGQDPYINGEAHGLAFSSKTKITPSLEIIFKELTRTGFDRHSVNLTDWAEQGVLLLNPILTTELHVSLAHEKFGWQDFTKEVVRYVLNLGNPIVVMLWGRKAEKFWDTVQVPYLDLTHVKVLRAYHPAAEARGSAKFVGNNHFVEANAWLCEQGLTPIKWNDEYRTFNYGSAS